MSRWRLDILLLAMMAPAMFILSRHAKAADVGQCIPIAQIHDAMAQDNQFSVAIGNEVQQLSVTNLTRTWGWIFLKNASGSTGYVLRTNAPIGEAYTEACVMEKLHDVKMADGRNPGVPTEVKLSFKATKETMQNVCSRERADSVCGYHNEMLQIWDVHNTGVMYYGIDTQGKLITLVGGSEGKNDGAMTETYLNTGIMVINHPFQNVAYLPKGVASLEGQK